MEAPFLHMTYDSSFWAIDGELIPEVANFKEKGLVTTEGWERGKEILKIIQVTQWESTRD